MNGAAADPHTNLFKPGEPSSPGALPPVPAISENGSAVPPSQSDFERAVSANSTELQHKLRELLLSGDVQQFNSLRPSTSIDLTGIDLSHRDLKGINLAHCNLTRANLIGCNLEGAHFESATVDQADFSKTFLNQAHFEHAKGNHVIFRQVQRADGCDFTAAVLSRAELAGGNFDYAIFNHATLNHATLVDGSFIQAQMQNVVLIGTMLDRAKFHKADMYRARMFQALGVDIDFTEAHLVEANTMRAVFRSSPPPQKSEEEKQQERTKAAQQTKTAPAPELPKTSFKGAWVKGLKEDGFGVKEDLLQDAIKDKLPPPNSYPIKPKPEELPVLMDGVPGTNLEMYQKAYQELHELIGLKNVKSLVEEIMEVVKLNYARKLEGLPDLNITVHICMIGSPGVGKTTVARLIGRLLCASGFLKKGHTIEVKRNDIVAEYAGQTAPLTNKKMLEALDGVFFLDEAYSLARDNNDAYGRESIDTIVPNLYNYRDRMVGIFAGYPKEMIPFLESNSGLKSRISFVINFEDYSNGQLIDIMKLQMGRYKFSYSSEVLSAGSVLMEILKAREGIHFGNGRHVEQAVQQATMRMAVRIKGRYDQPGAKSTIAPEDMPYERMISMSQSQVPWSELRWEREENGERKIYDYKTVPVQGDFPELNAESKELLRTKFAPTTAEIEEQGQLEEGLREVLRETIERHQADGGTETAAAPNSLEQPDQAPSAPIH
ncbi:MAG: pentapeptide repeat-containing protein [Oligoflexia bacterium]|nr:pentapeptide repeat-containing protein [Oligoflexia bacterium]